MQCPHCGNEVYQQITALNAAPNVNGCASTMTSSWVVNNTTMLNPMPSVCSGGLGFNPVVINSLDITANASEQQ
jgi:hypothetical protein